MLSSRPAEDVLEEIRQAAELGVQEVVITGIHLSSYGADGSELGLQSASHFVRLKGEPLVELLERVNEVAGIERIRLGSLEPRIICEEFMQGLSRVDKLCPHFHLSLQSGCDATLRRMRRKYDTKRYLQAVELLKKTFRHPAITTDLITGFPGETEEEFQETLEFIQSCGFARMHIFPYSQRPGTPAAEMEQVPKALRAERAHRAAEAAAAMRRAYLEECVGRTEEVLFEQPAGEEGLFLGHAPNYAEVLVKGTELHNQVRPVKITRTDGEFLFGELEE